MSGNDPAEVPSDDIPFDGGHGMTRAEKLKGLRHVMEQHSLDAYIIEGKDPHQSEQTAGYWESRKWISGFTGSEGVFLITRNRSALWVDPRYHLQGEIETQGSEIELIKGKHPTVEEIIPWLGEALSEGATVGLNKEEVSAARWKLYSNTLRDIGIQTLLVPDLLDALWIDRPALPENNIFEIPTELSGITREEKLARVRKHMRERGTDWFVLSSLDDIAWMLNLRGNDIPYHQLFLAYAYIGIDNCILCIDGNKIPPEIRNQLDADIVPYLDASSRLQKLLEEAPGVYAFDPDKTPMVIAEEIYSRCTSKEGRNITAELKSRKHPAELKSMEDIHILDGAAVVSFLFWLDMQEFASGQWDEYLLAEKLTSFRKARNGFLQESFPPIVAFGQNGAVIHYQPKKNEAAKITRKGILVLDSGGHYLGGTTDITRTIAIGEAGEEEKADYTQVLKGHLRLASVQFPDGTKGIQLDGLARQYLWEQGKEYGHGTGHGVGNMLCVHEGPASISQRMINIPLEEGMVLSNEPGIYHTGKYGIRIENLMYVCPGEENSFGKFLLWKQLTLCPYERKLIDCSLLTSVEREQINRYHQQVYQKLSPHLSKEENKWLLQKTRPLE